jgi:hypothetical protein
MNVGECGCHKVRKFRSMAFLSLPRDACGVADL